MTDSNQSIACVASIGFQDIVLECQQPRAHAGKHTHSGPGFSLVVRWDDEAEDARPDDPSYEFVMSGSGRRLCSGVPV